MNDQVHVFVGSFLDRRAACQYTEAQWDPEPDESVSDEEYSTWEERNPQWEMRSHLGVYLNSDFIETIDGPQRYDYLSTMLTEPGAIDSIRSTVDASENILVLIFSEALGGFPAQLCSTPRLRYCGRFACKLAPYEG